MRRMRLIASSPSRAGLPEGPSPSCTSRTRASSRSLTVIRCGSTTVKRHEPACSSRPKQTRVPP